MSTSTFGTAKGALPDSPYIPYTFSGNNLTLNSGFNLAMNADGDITLNGLVNAGTGNVTLISGGAIVNGMGSATSIIAASLAAYAANGIGSSDPRDPLMTEVHNITAVNTTSNNIDIDNVGVLNVIGLSNGGTGNVLLQNIGGITTYENTVTSSGGTVSITAHSPLTIGSGGVSAYGSISLATSGSSNLTIAGNIASSNGNISLMAPGGSIAVSPGVSLSAPNGTVTLNAGTSTVDLSVVGNNAATDNTVSSLITAMGAITSDESGDDEDARKKKNKEGGEQKTDEKKMDDDKKYCN